MTSPGRHLRAFPAAMAVSAGLLLWTGCAPQGGAVRKSPAAPAAVSASASIHTAAAEGNLALVKSFLSRGTLVDLTDKDDWTPLMKAAAGGHVPVIDELLNRKASHAIRDKNGVTALHAAAWSGKTEAVHRLMARGADVEARTKYDYTPLMAAAGQGHLATMKALLSMGADVNARGKSSNTALHDAAGKGKAEVIELLVSHGADVDAKDASGQTPIFYAGLSRHDKALAALVRAGARAGGNPGRVGIEVGETDGAVQVVKAMADGPAAKAGLLPGDTIVVVGGHQTAGLKLGEVVDLIRGPAGEKLVITVSRKGIEGNLDFTIIRDSAVVMPAAAAAGGTAANPSPPVSAPAAVSPAKELSSDADRPRYRSQPKADDYALVIGIEDYARLPDARFAKRDAEAMRRHLEALGVPRRNIIHLSGNSATRASLQGYLEEWLPRNVKPGSRVYFYYSGHGAPDPQTGDAFIVPWDGDPMFLKSSAYPISELFTRLGSLKVKEVLVALDACFSGAGGRSVLAKGARPLVVKVKESLPPNGTISVLTAASGEEITATREDQGHGLFTYHLLKGLNEGRRGTRELFEYLKPLVSDDARRQNRDQTPSFSGLDLPF